MPSSRWPCRAKRGAGCPRDSRRRPHHKPPTRRQPSIGGKGAVYILAAAEHVRRPRNPCLRSTCPHRTPHPYGEVPWEAPRVGEASRPAGAPALGGRPWCAARGGGTPGACRVACGGVVLGVPCLACCLSWRFPLSWSALCLGVPCVWAVPLVLERPWVLELRPCLGDAPGRLRRLL